MVCRSYPFHPRMKSSNSTGNKLLLSFCRKVISETTAFIMNFASRCLNTRLENSNQTSIKKIDLSKTDADVLEWR